MNKRIISVVTLLCLLVSCLPMSAFANECKHEKYQEGKFIIDPIIIMISPNDYNKCGEVNTICSTCKEVINHMDIPAWDVVEKSYIKKYLIDKNKITLTLNKKYYSVPIINDDMPLFSDNENEYYYDFKAKVKYQVKYMFNGKEKVITSNNNKLTIKNIKKNTKYCIQVRNGYTDPNGVAHWSKWANKVNITVK